MYTAMLTRAGGRIRVERILWYRLSPLVIVPDPKPLGTYQVTMSRGSLVWVTAQHKVLVIAILKGVVAVYRQAWRLRHEPRFLP
jgi:hypothetical protein